MLLLSPRGGLFAATWRRHEQSGRPLPAIEAATAATNGSGSPACGTGGRTATHRGTRRSASVECLDDVRREAQDAADAAVHRNQEAAPGGAALLPPRRLLRTLFRRCRGGGA